MKVETLTDMTDHVMNPRWIQITQVDNCIFRFKENLNFLQVHRWLVEHEMTFDIRVYSLYTEDKEEGSAGMETVVHIRFEKEEEAALFKLRWM